MKRNIKITVAWATALLMTSSAIAGAHRISRGSQTDIFTAGRMPIDLQAERETCERLLEELTKCTQTVAEPTAEQKKREQETIESHSGRVIDSFLGLSTTLFSPERSSLSAEELVAGGAKFVEEQSETVSEILQSWRAVICPRRELNIKMLKRVYLGGMGLAAISVMACRLGLARDSILMRALRLKFIIYLRDWDCVSGIVLLLREIVGGPTAVEEMKETLVRLVGEEIAERILAKFWVMFVLSSLTCSEEKWQALKSQ